MNELTVTGRIESFDEEKREVDVFVLPWDKDAETYRGVERFQKGAFAGIDPKRFVFRQRHQDPPTGRGIDLREEEDGLHMRFRISKTQAGDEQLTLVKDGVETGVSVGFEDSKHKKQTLRDGRTLYTHSGLQDSRQLEVSTTWKPAFREAAVLQVLEAPNVTDKAEAQAEIPAEVPAEATASATTFSGDSVTPAMLADMESRILHKYEALQDRIAAKGLTLPESLTPGAVERRVEIQIRELAEVISSDNTGVLPIPVVGAMTGIIDSSRPFLESTDRLPTPPAGETLRIPKITQRPQVGKQTAEKDELASRKTIIGYDDFTMATYGGAGDLSLQLLKRSSPDFLNLWLQLLGEQYAIETDNAAVDALLAVAAVNEGTGGFNPSAPAFGEAFSNAATAAGSRPGLLPNRIWMGTAALVAFINAKTPTGGGGTPMYPGLASIAGIQGGDQNGPANFSMRPVWVPALDDEAVDIIIGPSRGFQWVEDGTYTLQADVPSKAGRDVGLAGMVWFAPVYPAAFTTYALTS